MDTYNSPKTSSIIVLLILGLAFTLIALIVVPAFYKMFNRTHHCGVGEISNLKNLVDGAAAYYYTEHVDIEGNPVAPQFPTSDYRNSNHGATNPKHVPKDEEVMVSDWSNPAWEGLKFKTVRSQRYRYTYQPNNQPNAQTGVRATFSAYAEGDLDGDGITSKFIVTGSVDEQGELTTSPVFLEDDDNELE